MRYTMANSKSTIYPIQLQGAELNLNKLDAEIKQYSGFNKNNSPFVGGCLSNVFIKNSALEDSTDSNTYIDENGDIYTVKTDGFYKNGEKIKDLSAPFVNLKELPLLSHPHRYFSENVIVTLINKAVYLNGEFIADMDDSQTDNDLLDKYITGISFKYDGEIYFIFACQGFSKFRYRVLNLTTGETAYDYTSADQEDEKGLDVTFPITIMFDDTEGKVAVYYSRRNNYEYVYISSDFLSEGSIGNATYFNKNATEINKGSDDLIPSLNRYVEMFKLLGYPYNKILVDIVSNNINVSKNYYYAFDYDFSTTTSEILKLNYSLPGNKYIAAGTTIENWSNGKTGSGNKALYDETQLIRGSLTYISNGDHTKFLCFQFEKLFACSVSSDRATQPASYYKLFNNYVLFLNNGLLSGIGVYYEDCNTVLISNWNTVNPFSLSFTPNANDEYYSMCYQDNGKYYLITLDNIPKLRKTVNQLVLNNITTNYNSYFLDRDIDKWGLFAPGFNGAYCYANSNTVKNYEVLNISERYYGFAVNEYELKKNPSIIINPIKLSLGYEIDFYGSKHFISLGFVNINIYMGSEKVDYLISWTINNTYFNKNLKNLPFPSDANGNVQYSPSLFSNIESEFGNMAFIKTGNVMYPLIKGNENNVVMAYYLASGIENIVHGFIIQGQYYGIINESIYAIQFVNGVVSDIVLITDISNLQFVGNTPYEALFFSKTNRCLYSFTGANVLNQKQLIDKISEVRSYLYNPATQTVFLITDIGVLFYGLFGVFLLEFTDISKIFLLENGIVMSDNSGNYRYIKYYLDEGDTDYVKENINIETCFYGMNNEVVTINDCLYFRLFSEEHEEGDLKVSATTISLSGRKTEETTFKIKATDWDKITHTIYLRYQPKAQRGLGVSFSIDSPFKIASLSVGSQPDAVLIDKVSKGAIIAPQQTSNNIEW